MEWRDLSGYEGQYQVSDTGRVRSLDRVVPQGGYSTFRRGQELSPYLGKRGYMSVNIKRRSRTVHQLVLEAFVGPRPPGMEVLHGNGDRTDNRLSNLRYGTPSENGLDAVRHRTNACTVKTHCPRNHEYTPENTFISRRSNGRTFRVCRCCHIARTNAAYHRRKEVSA